MVGSPPSPQSAGAPEQPRQRAATFKLSAEPVGSTYFTVASDAIEVALASTGSDALRVVVATGPERGGELVVEYLFTHHCGFRCLDEGDLMRFWQSGALSPGRHLHRITSGGWLDQEREVPGAFSAASGLQEWLIATDNRSVGVIAGEDPPLIREFRG